MTKSFEAWEYEEIESLFNLTRVYEHSTLSEWVYRANVVAIDESLERFLYNLQKRLIINADAWNEDELKMFFIAPLLSQVPLEFDDFKPFTQRTLTAHFPSLSLDVSGKVEFILARGKQRPKQPFFFLHEYKQERRRDNDPLGQLLIAMLAARANNEKETVLYGCYVVGRDWFFVILDKQEYAVSLAFDATKPELFQIHTILSEIPSLIKKILAN
jgi:hypothetical protein